ncbi:MAG TPA: hypothetical protein VE442_23675 [Jatrophihabitans sp.]|nr:hypothetical protein [Jatrophihabitans sp.]
MADAICELRSDELAVTLLPDVGARLHKIEVFGVDVLRTPATTDRHRADPFFWGGYHQAPWCNRLDANLAVRVGTQTVTLQSNFPDGSAIHGQVYDRPWAVADDGTFTIRGGGAGGWPWTYTLTLRAAVDGARLSLDYELTNTSDEPMPAGLGLHPWFRNPALVRIPTTEVFPLNAGPMGQSLELPTARQLPIDTDACWTDLTEPVVEVIWPDQQLAMTMSAGTEDLVVVAAHPAQVGAVAVEPQTHAPAGLRRLLDGEPHAMQWVAPGAALRLAVSLAFRRWS